MNMQAYQILNGIYRKISIYLQDLGKDPLLRRVAIGIIILDLLFVVIHLYMMKFHFIDRFHPLSLEADRGASEVFQYAKEILIGLCFAVYAVRLRIWALFIWAGIFLCFFWDDCFRVHEELGNYVERFAMDRFDLALGNGVSELIAIAPIGAFFLIALTGSMIFAGKRFRQISIVPIALCAVLVFFGLFVDFIHSILPGGTFIHRLFAAIEDGGELVTMSLILIYALSFFRLEASHTDLEGDEKGEM